ncbi:MULTISPECIES: exodeoxyribonuclease V subunit alpha [Mycobacterium]|uniref:exodeoxyribonuclease V subunit alpha n=1 Tax=Mycobacterium TaxID=1763 RepID=UPI0004D43A35|nr:MULTISPECIES: exodeoxyribonuclease V subunit alpha [Mycobacterium]ARR80051.1 Exodeoxyribonuclease V alpha chain [Mycobacterium intracellulare subsp. yongonense]ARR85119.1 Exodeoxyribonuclease V alpha chain [Mycobacterium intracellulare subsp. yongonense]ASX02316.1 exodeoxyribonuclease V subunit alpha [Mycobacterium intracellulare subsp. chimaera]KEF98078.1 RecBCD enzyme subunit RecD [Mycobacterium sp. TKK-01-0059]PBA59451.1 exodeoxyribonuclease V subunit alpha [Mycobacterium intracellulare 
MTADVMFATGLLRTFSDAGVFEAADVHVAQRLTALTGESDERVALAVALVVRALRGGSVCVDLRAASGLLGDAELPWPGADDWLAAVRASALVGPPPVLRFFGDLLYFDRYWLEEEQVCTDLLALSASPIGIESSSYERLFEPGYEEQRAAAEIAVSQAVTVLTGGPGTGKTTTIARLLALLLEHAERAGMPPPRIALAAPTGKAAARLAEAVAAGARRLGAADRARLAGLSGTTLHRLLGPRPDTSVRFKHNRANRLPHDVIVVDETSMVSLTMMARLAEAVRPDSRLILVGDPDQLASVEAGAVLADLVDGLSARGDVRVAALRTPHRYGTSIGALAEAIRVGDADRVVELLAAGGEHVEWVDAQRPADRLREVLVAHALRLRSAALLGAADEALATLDEHRLLCAHREGPYGATHWNTLVQKWIADATGQPAWSQWYAGRPLLVTANDYGLRLYNGDTGVAVAGAEGLRAVIAGASGPLDFATSRLGEVETMHAMTIHKSQGSQADEVTVLIPPEDSRLLTRELFYTAVTRAQTRVRVVGPEASVRAAIERRAMRATGLRQRLRADAAAT